MKLLPDTVLILGVGMLAMRRQRAFIYEAKFHVNHSIVWSAPNIEADGPC